VPPTTSRPGAPTKPDDKPATNTGTTPGHTPQPANPVPLHGVRLKYLAAIILILILIVFFSTDWIPDFPAFADRVKEILWSGL
jgi:hypothetical protein